MGAVQKLRIALCSAAIVSCLLPFAVNAQTAAQLTIDAAQTLGALDLSRFSVGQGGLSAKPMFDDKLAEMKAMHPATIRFFVQEYYHLLPAANTYHWVSLDTMLDLIVATGARPIPCVCFKPKVLYPTIDQFVTIPNSWAGWDTLCYRLAKHCLDKNYGIQYWEIGNEIESGENGGCPYLFNGNTDDYLQWYTHTANAIRMADPTAKVGGPALCCDDYASGFGKQLAQYCANGGAPLDFYSWHAYGGGEGKTDTVKQMLAQYPSLSNVETMITEWQPSIAGPSGLLETTKWYLEEGLNVSAYYHIRDYKVDTTEFLDFMSHNGAIFMANWWSGTGGGGGGIFDFNGKMQPSYYVFCWLSRLKGTQLKTTCSTADIRCWAVKNGTTNYAVFWNMGSTGYNVTISLPSTTTGNFVLKTINTTTVHDDTLRSGSVQGLSTTPLEIGLGGYGGIGWLEFGTGSTATVAAPRQHLALKKTPVKTIWYDLRGQQVETNHAHGLVIAVRKSLDMQIVDSRVLVIPANPALHAASAK